MESQVTKDPVCGMEVGSPDAKFKATFDGKTYSFCSAQCKKAFEEKPHNYAERVG